MDAENSQVQYEIGRQLDPANSSSTQRQSSQKDTFQVLSTTHPSPHWPSDEQPQLSSQAEDVASLFMSDPADSSISGKLQKFAKDVRTLEERASKSQAIIQRQQVQIQHLSEASSPQIIAQLREELSMCKQENEALLSLINKNSKRQQLQPANQVGDKDPNWVVVNSALETTTESPSMMLYPDSPLMKRIDELQQTNAKLFKANKEWHSKWEELRRSKQVEKDELVSRLKQAEEEIQRLKDELVSHQNKAKEDKEKEGSFRHKEKDAQIALLRQQLTVFMQDFEKEKKEKRDYRERFVKKEKECEKLKIEQEQRVKSLIAEVKVKDEKIKAGDKEKTRLQFRIFQLMDEVREEKSRAETGASRRPGKPITTYVAPQQVSNSPTDMTSLIYPSSAGAPLAALYSSQFAIGHRRGPEDLPGAWSCPDCTFLNFPDRTVCDMCGLTKSLDGQMGFGDVGELQSRGASPSRGIAVPDAFADVEVDRAY